jgi:hypothetical protein
MSDIINSSVADSALCWCDGRKKRNSLVDSPPPAPPGFDRDDGMKLRFYTEEELRRW